ncbi:MAG: NAD-dependent epimerase/dehydratase family protein, partial [Opitutaceae bacterium]
ITLHGDGRQVRDILHVDDLVDAFLIGQARIHELSGRHFNIGGGPERSISLLELIDLITEVHGLRPELDFAPWRVTDQRYFVSDTRRFRTATGWTPQIGTRDGVRRLHGGYWKTPLSPIAVLLRTEVSARCQLGSFSRAKPRPGMKSNFAPLGSPLPAGSCFRT